VGDEGCVVKNFENNIRFIFFKVGWVNVPLGSHWLSSHKLLVSKSSPERDKTSSKLQ